MPVSDDACYYTGATREIEVSIFPRPTDPTAPVCWAHFSWVILNLEKHLGSKQEFTNWLTTMYLFYLSNRIVDFESGVKLMPEIHNRLSYLREQDRVAPPAESQRAALEYILLEAL